MTGAPRIGDVELFRIGLGTMPMSVPERPSEEQAIETIHAAIDAGVKFGTSFPEHPDAAGVLTRAAEDIFAAQDLQRAIEVANLVLAHQPPADQPKRRIAYTIIGQSNFDYMALAGRPGSEPLPGRARSRSELFSINYNERSVLA